MKKTMLVLTMVLLTSSYANAQNRKQHANEENRQSRTERIEKRIAKLNEELELNAEQKEKFSTLYKQMTEEIMNAHQPMRPHMQKLQAEKKKKELTEQEARERLQKRFERSEKALKRQQEVLEIHKKYSEKMGEFLNAKQLLKVFTFRQAEHSAFRHHAQNKPMGHRKNHCEACNHEKKVN